MSFFFYKVDLELVPGTGLDRPGDTSGKYRVAVYKKYSAGEPEFQYYAAENLSYEEGKIKRSEVEKSLEKENQTSNE